MLKRVTRAALWGENGGLALFHAIFTAPLLAGLVAGWLA